MSAPEDGVDWDEAERRERRRDLLAAPILVAFSTGIVLLTGGFSPWTGGAAWVAVGTLLALAGLALGAAQLSRRQRARLAAAYRVQAALRAHADPGPQLRARADVRARYTVRTARIAGLAALGPLALLLGGDWDRRPIAAAAGAVLVLGTTLPHAWWYRDRLAAARRWLADPPGPPREAPPPTTAEHWLTGPWVAVLAGSFLALGFLLALGVTLAGRG